MAHFFKKSIHADPGINFFAKKTSPWLKIVINWTLWVGSKLGLTEPDKNVFMYQTAKLSQNH